MPWWPQLAAASLAAADVRGLFDDCPAGNRRTVRHAVGLAGGVRAAAATDVVLGCRPGRTSTYSGPRTVRWLFGDCRGVDRCWSGREADVRIDVLGPVRAWRDEMALDLGPARQRGLLGLLALATGRPVGRADLVDALWPDRPPPSAIGMIHTYVQRLRRVLEPGRAPYRPSTVLPVVGDGYALRVPAGTVDAQRFRALVTAAADAQRAGRPGTAAATFAEALALWAGPPLADVPGLPATRPWARWPPNGTPRWSATGRRWPPPGSGPRRYRCYGRPRPRSRWTRPCTPG